jgi:hypothetical protein
VASLLLPLARGQPAARAPHPDRDRDDPAERTDRALRELWAFYGRTHKMYASLPRDEPVVAIVQRLLRDFHAYLRAIEGSLIAGCGLRGHAARRTRVAIGHARRHR